MDQVEEVKERVNIVDIIGERVELKKAGKNFKALCPFHQEKTPSFMVSPELQIYKCFGCGETGDVFSFLEKYEGMSFFESLQYLAERLGIKLKRINLAKSDKKIKLYEINALTARFYNYVLLEHKVGKSALSYLLEKRGLKLDTIRKFNLGFSPHDSLPLFNFLTKKKGFTKEDLLESGTFYPKGSTLADRFAGRVIFPIYDHRDNVVAFGGRILPVDEEKDLAKYINSPETLVYKKSNILYGLNFAKEYIKREDFVVITEGELDMISSYQAGIRNTVAVKGSALTDDQSKLLLRFTENFVFAYDTDSAGVMAVKRGAVVAQKAGATLKAAVLGSYKDPDDAARANPEGFKKAILEAVPIWDFLIDLSFKKNDPKTGEGKARISKELKPILARIEDKIVQAHYVKLVSEKLAVPISAVFEELEKEKTKTPALTERGEVITERRSRRELLEEKLLAFLFQRKHNLLLDDSIASLFSRRANKRLVDRFRNYWGERRSFDPHLFFKALPPELSEAFSSLLLYDVDASLDSKESVDKEIKDLIRDLRREILKEDIERLVVKIKKAEKDKDNELLAYLKKEFAGKTEELSALNGEDIVV